MKQLNAYVVIVVISIIVAIYVESTNGRFSVFFFSAIYFPLIEEAFA